ncbi:chaperonin 10-like protein [Phyllosticta capitalensis]|uniref:D-xylulose reductase n=1 Tax=Phyllosticta capitalensis TaxID=121624 RepID=A0ABR1YNU8_9PEZI
MADTTTTTSSWPAEDEKNPSLLLYAPGDARYENRPIPQPSDPRDVLVRIAYVGCCGSDVHFWRHGGMTHKVSPSNPIVMGHEASGTIASLASPSPSSPPTGGLRPGDRVAIEPGFPCRSCAVCKSGRYNLCRAMRFAAAPRHGDPAQSTHGTLSKYFRIPSDFCYRIPDSVGLDEAVLVEPLAVAVHAAKLAGVRHGQRVVVFGAGTIGVFCAAVARAFGASAVVVVDVLQRKLEFARSFVDKGGVEGVRPEREKSPEENARRIVDAANAISSPSPSDAQGVDVVLEATGAEACVQTGIHALSPGGTFIQVGLGASHLQFPMVVMSEKELNVKGCFRYGAGDFETALALMAEGAVPVRRLISSEVPFERATEAWERTARGEGIKNLIRGVEG